MKPGKTDSLLGQGKPPRNKRKNKSLPAAAAVPFPVDDAPASAPTKGSKRKRKSEADDDDVDDTSGLTKSSLDTKRWALEFMNTRGLFKNATVALDCRLFMPPQKPVSCRLQNPARVTQLLEGFSRANLSPAKILFMDTDEDGNTLPNLKWDQMKSASDLQKFFNQKTMEEVIAALGEPWVIGGYHSSAALVKFCIAHPGEIPTRACYMYRLSHIQDDENSRSTKTRMQRMYMAGALSACDNANTKRNEGYDAQSPLALAFLWKNLYDMAGRPFMRPAGKHTKEFVQFRAQCVAQSENLENLLQASATSITPLLKVAVLPDNEEGRGPFHRMFTVLSCFDDNVNPSGLHLHRLEYVVPIPPLTEAERQANKKWKGRSMKFEDLKDIARVPYEDRCKFIDLVYFDKYVLGALGHPEDADVTLTPQVGSITRCVISNSKHVLKYIYKYIHSAGIL